jgi:hypothetical protein
VLGALVGDPLGRVLGELLGLADGAALGRVLGDAFALLRGACGLAVPGTGVLVPVRWARLDVPVGLAAGDGRWAGVDALADADLAGGGALDDAVRNAPAISSTTSAMPVTTAATTAIVPARRRRRRAWSSSWRMPVPVDMRAGTAHSAETYPGPGPAAPGPGPTWAAPG